jgi:hypothetical protein
MALPFIDLPTRLLRPYETKVTYTAPQQQHLTPVSSVGVKRELDESVGMAILEYIYSKKDGALNKESKDNGNGRHRRRGGEESHKASFYMEPSVKQRGDARNLGVIDRLTDSLGIPSKAKVKFITKEVLMRNDVTVQMLIEECKVGITDLKVGGIVERFQDLIDLKFRMLDVVSNRTLFNVSHLYTLFHVGYKELRRHPNVQFCTLDLLQCQFCASELQTLQFSFDRLVEKGALNAIQLHCLNFSLSDLITLNLQPQHLHTLGISKHDAIDRFGWDIKEYRRFVRK